MLRDIHQYSKEELYRYLEELIAQYDSGTELYASEQPHRHSPPMEMGGQEVIPAQDPGAVNQLLGAAQVLQQEVFGIIKQFRELNQRLESQVNERSHEVAIKEANLSALIENTDDMILSVDMYTQVLVVNQSFKNKFYQYTGIAIQEGHRMDRLLPPERAEELYALLERAKKGEPFKDIKVIDLPERRTFYELSFNPIRNRDQQITGVSFFGKDITKRETAQREIREQQQLLASINYSITEGIFRVAPGKGILYVNKAFAEMFGYNSPEEVKALDPYDLYVDTKRRDEFVRLIKEKGSFINEEVHFRRKDGSTFWGLISSILSYDNDGNLLHDGAVRDITEVKETKRQLEDQNKALKKVNEELDSFVYSTSHDLRAPLVSVKGLVDVARIADSEDERDMYFQLIEQSIDKLDNFIKDIISFSRNARTQTQVSAIDLEEVTQEAFDDLLYQEGVSEMELKVKVRPPAGKLHTDRTRLTMVLNNLISNSIRYRDTSKSLPFLHVEAEIDAEKATILVKDNGQGIPEDILPKIFNMFYRGTTLSKGSGIGLYIVRETLQKLGGTISVESTAGEGTTFMLEIPHMLDMGDAPSN